MTETPNGKRDFFVSFTQTDRAWAAWTAWALEEAGYSVFFQDWDFRGNFVLEMDKAHTRSRRTVAVLSPDYLASRFAAPEWAARFAQDATSEHDLLIPVRVRPCQLEGLLAQIVYVDLVGCGEAAARDLLLRRVEGIRLKPDEPPLFPGQVSHEVVPERPSFPAATSPSGRIAEHHAPTTSRQTSPPPWLIGTVAVAVVSVVTIIWLLTSGPSATVGGSGIANTGTQTIQGPVNIGGTPPEAKDK